MRLINYLYHKTVNAVIARICLCIVCKFSVGTVHTTLQSTQLHTTYIRSLVYSVVYNFTVYTTMYTTAVQQYINY